MSEYQPKIVAFVCNWCTYTAADLAGTARLAYPAEIRLVRLMCSGMLDPKYVLAAFLEGADGVFVGGCHPGDCHYINGNLKQAKRLPGIRELLAQFGIEEARLRLEWIGASEGPEFQEHMEHFVKTIQELGPSPVRETVVV